MAEQRVGKYRIVERIGRGGMGMIFKAHDPVLDRQVAVKVIAPDVDVTDELRARFFREAQACARLNHPNVVTVYDMGEDDGRLFIVMELLEGQELRRFIAPPGGLTLEEKLSVISQVCGGLHYAHQKGIVHRDVKPSNIFLLRNGVVKILDFGIAHMATTDGLTRTGLIMGTLRYISPEQLRGRADYRSDMFSLGSVCYELLALRPPFSGEDPMHLLEQLRTEDPPLLNDVDGNIPPDLASIVQRAMRKNPAERFHDLDEMRVEIEQVQRTIADERQRVSAHVRAQCDRIARLQSEVAERLGRSGHEADIPRVDPRMGLVKIRELEHALDERIVALEAEISDAEAASPAVQRAEALLRAGRYEEAVLQFEAVVVEVPELLRAQEGLELARAEADAQRRRRRGMEVIEKARAALTARRYTQCLEIVNEAVELRLPADLAQELSSLREQVLAEQEARRRGVREAEEAAKQSAAARTSAEAEEAQQYASGNWNEAQALAGTAEANLRRGAYGEAKDGFERAAAAFGEALKASRQAQAEERRTAERARDAATLGQQQAQAAGAEQYASELWRSGENKFAEAQAAFAQRGSGRGAAAFNAASALYRQAEEAARNARDRERRRAEAARERADEGHRSAAALNAERWAQSAWQDAVAKSAAGEAAWLRKQYLGATEAFEAALRLYHQAQSQIREAARRQREEAVGKQRQIAAARQGAASLGAATNAATEWMGAEASGAAAEAALERCDWDQASTGFDRAAELYRVAETRAREVQQERADAERAVAAMGIARAAAASVDAAKYAPEPWGAAANAETRAVTALSQQRYGSARALLAESERLYIEARGVAAATPRISTPPVRPSRTDALDETIVHRAEATLRAPTILNRTPSPVDDATVLVPPVSNGTAAVASDSGGDGTPAKSIAIKRPTLRTMLVTAGGIAAVLLIAVAWPRNPRPVPPVDPKPRATLPAPAPTALDRLAAEVRVAREEGIKVGADTLAPTRFAVAGEKEGAARKASDVGTAEKRYREALAEYKLATQAAVTVTAEKKEAEKAERRVTDARQAAARAGASRLSPAAWNKGTTAQARAEEALRQQVFDRALAMFAEAQRAYEDAARDAGAPPPPVLRVDKEKKERDDAEGAGRVAVAARREAEQANAGSLARQAFAAAQAKEAEGEAALRGQQFASARQRFLDAQDAFRRAAQEAQAAAAAVVAADKAREEAALRDREATAAREREAAAAREREAAAARERQRAEEARALEVSKQREIALARRGVEQLRARTVSRRDEAVAAEAGRLARTIFETAEKRQAEADALAGRQNFSDASHRYQDALDLYLEAKVRAEAVTEARKQADNAKAQMLVEKRRASAATPEYAEAQNEERQANLLYERLSYNEAAEKYRSTATLYGKALKPSPPPVPAPVAPKRSIPPPF